MFELDYRKKAQEIETFLTSSVKSAGFSDAVIAISGGVDSAASLSLAARALGKEHVYVMLLPYGEKSNESLEHGKLVVENAGLPADHIFIRNIQSAVDEIISQTKDRVSDIRKGNIMARVRMIYLYDLAKKLNVLVVGTENKSEYYLGYFTRFGDEASDIEPIRSLYKTQVWEMAKFLKVPHEIIGKAPSAGLWEGQSDEGEFGFSYLDADKVLYMHFEEKKKNEEIIASGIDKKIVDNVLSFVQKNHFKHDVPKIFDS